MMTFFTSFFLLLPKKRFLVLESSFLRFCQNKRNSLFNLQNFRQLIEKSSFDLMTSFDLFFCSLPKRAYFLSCIRVIGSKMLEGPAIEKQARWENIQLRFWLSVNINGTINPCFETTKFFSGILWQKKQKLFRL